jgi:hypothetical protein
VNGVARKIFRIPNATAVVEQGTSTEHPDSTSTEHPDSRKGNVEDVHISSSLENKSTLIPLSTEKQHLNVTNYSILPSDSPSISKDFSLPVYVLIAAAYLNLIALVLVVVVDRIIYCTRNFRKWSPQDNTNHKKQMDV